MPAEISFKSHVFAIEIAEEEQIVANQGAAERAQVTATKGLQTANVAHASAKEAQASPDEAQYAANQSAGDAQLAADLGVLDAAAVQMINKRVSELDDYETVAEISVSLPF